MDIGLATVAAATIAALFAYLTKVHSDNRGDHADVARRIDEMRVTQLEIRQDITDIKADVSRLAETDRTHEGRLERLEHPGEAA